MKVTIASAAGTDLGTGAPDKFIPQIGRSIGAVTDTPACRDLTDQARPHDDHACMDIVLALSIGHYQVPPLKVKMSPTDPLIWIWDKST